LCYDDPIYDIYDECDCCYIVNFDLEKYEIKESIKENIQMSKFEDDVTKDLLDIVKNIEEEDIFVLNDLKNKSNIHKNMFFDWYDKNNFMFKNFFYQKYVDIVYEDQIEQGEKTTKMLVNKYLIQEYLTTRDKDISNVFENILNKKNIK